MRSAGQNLADGVVRDPGHVTTYGTLIDREARRLGDMVDQVLEFAGMQSGRITLDHEPVAIDKLIDEALAECRPTLEEKAITVETDYVALPAMIGDGSALRRAIVNLLTNAMKHGAGGGWIGVRARSVAGSPPRIEVTVEDCGPGIAAVDLPHIFEPFYRGRTAGSVPGSGLGLTLVRQIAEAHGGRVTVQTYDSNGTAFTLHLPTTP
jgi:signal transduction histidine kinase